VNLLINRRLRQRQDGIAIIIVLAFVVLLAGIVVAYLSRTSTDRQVAHGSFNETKADQLARSALEVVVSDLKQEIANGPTITSSTVMPQRSPTPAPGTTPAIPNLIRRSVRSDAIPSPPAVRSRASAVNSTSDASINGRSVSFARWNSHYLVPKANTGDSSSDPITTGFSPPNYWAPDWVIVTRNGPVVFDVWNYALADASPTNSNYSIGRYAYAVYDEGGLLDFNVAGYPYPSPSPAVTPSALVTNIGRKGVIGFADLTAMKITGGGSTPNPTTVTKMVAWRNYATLKSSGNFPNISPTPDPAASDFVNYVLSIGRDFRTVATTSYNNRTDQAFVSRKELIELFRSIGGSFNMLQFLGTFSRERNVPTWQAGTAAITQRFSIGNLNLIRPNPGAAQTADIQEYFGLQWVNGTPGNGGTTPPTPAIPGHWKYIGATGATLQDRIPAFTSNPEFFQLLNYAMNSTNADDMIHIFTTLSIGAAIIDQYDDGTAADPTTGTTTTMMQYNGGWAFGLENTDPARPPSPAPSPFPPPAGMSPTPPPAISTYVMLNRPFRNVGEFGYAFRTAPGPTPTPSPNPKTLDFYTATSPDAPILDFFTYNTASPRAGIVNLNTQNIAVIAAILKGAITSEASSSVVGQAASNNAAASPTPNPTIGIVTNAATGTEGTLVKPVRGRADMPRLAAAAGTTIGSSEEAKETIARVLAEVGQTRTWGLIIDVIAQSGRYPPTATGLADFVVEGEKRYWLHVAIDRFTGEIIDQQLEAVYE